MSSTQAYRRVSKGILFLAIALGTPIMAVAQTFQNFTVPTSSCTHGLSTPEGIAVGPDGALWVADKDCNSVERVTTAGAIVVFPAPQDGTNALNRDVQPLEIAAGSDGALWFTEAQGTSLGRITTSGTITELPLPSGSGTAMSIAAGSDGALWITLPGTAAIGRMTTGGSASMISIPSGNSPNEITPGPDGALWFTETGQKGTIGRITTTGTVTEFPMPSNIVPVFVSTGVPLGIVAGPDGALWSTAAGAFLRIATNGSMISYTDPSGTSGESMAFGPDGALYMLGVLGSISPMPRSTTAGVTTSVTIPSSDFFSYGVAGADGALWFTNALNGTIIRMALGNSNASPLVAAVLPSSRSIQVGGTATAFATIINSGTSSASGCAIAPVTSVPANFTYQTTNPATNALTGTANTPATIAAGQSQTFVFALGANASVTPTQVVLGFDCSGTNAAPSNTGLNTLLYSASSSPVPDIVALSATATNDGILHITGTSGSSAFALATVNVGASSSITASANTGSTTLPLSLSLCQTNPSNGQCISPIGPTATTAINANATPTFAIFGTASGSIPFSPAANRIFVQFTDSNGVVHGSTSVAVETQ